MNDSNRDIQDDILLLDPMVNECCICNATLMDGYGIPDDFAALNVLISSVIDDRESFVHFISVDNNGAKDCNFTVVIIRVAGEVPLKYFDDQGFEVVVGIHLCNLVTGDGLHQCNVNTDDLGIEVVTGFSSLEFVEFSTVEENGEVIFDDGKPTVLVNEDKKLECFVRS